MYFQMLDFETSSSKSEVSKSNSWEITSFSKTTLLQREPCQQLSITRYLIRCYANKYLEYFTNLSGALKNGNLLWLNLPRSQLDILCFASRFLSIIITNNTIIWVVFTTLAFNIINCFNLSVFSFVCYVNTKHEQGPSGENKHLKQIVPQKDVPSFFVWPS